MPPSRVECTSSSTPSASSITARRKAAREFSYSYPDAPRWAMTLVRRMVENTVASRQSRVTGQSPVASRLTTPYISFTSPKRDSAMRRWPILTLALASLLGLTSMAQAPVVYRITVSGVVENGLAPYVARSIREAEQAGAAAAYLDIDTPGGRIDAAERIADAVRA